ncbi:hypothetical protein LJC26_06645, partial [Desulfovibrio sp. OttesenSCG-928-O18]|nr:hypothetical protein [Desulfovibrio sp. OttesenSCG-928-O18]
KREKRKEEKEALRAKPAKRIPPKYAASPRPRRGQIRLMRRPYFNFPLVLSQRAAKRHSNKGKKGGGAQDIAKNRKNCPLRGSKKQKTGTSAF